MQRYLSTDRTSRNHATATQLNNVVVISIDALHPEAIELVKIPTIKKLMQAGSYTLDVWCTEPTKTLIAHTAMFTDLSPREGGKVDNDWMH